jgi:hypothetical protein
VEASSAATAAGTQPVIRMNHDTPYRMAILDLQAMR